MNLSSLVGNRLQEERKNRGLSQAEAGAVAGVSREMWGRYERGALPGGEALLALAAAGFDVGYILTGQRTPKAVLSAEESSLLDNYHHADEKGKAAARAVLEAVSSQKQKAA